jgi:hypothetical protein
MKKYIVEVLKYVQNTKLESNCNSLQFINTGTQTLTINTVQLLPSQTLTISGNENEMDVTQYTLAFGTAALVNELTVIRKTYQ